MKYKDITFADMLHNARRILREKGIHALYNPHAATGKICRCGNCFCCAAWQVWCEARKEQGK